MKNLKIIIVGFIIVAVSCTNIEVTNIVDSDILHTYKIDYTPYRIELLKEYAEAHYSEYYLKTTGSPEWPGVEIDPKVIVLHFTAVPTLEGTVDVFTPDTLRGRPNIGKAGKANVGVQFLVDRDGSIYQITPVNYFNRHCIGLNHCSIGVENIGLGDITRKGLRGKPQEGPQMTLEQVKSNIALVRYLKNKYPGIEILIGHLEYTELEDPSHPGYEFFHENDPNYRTEKTDPGKRFMKAVRKELKDIIEPGTRGVVLK